MQKFKSVICDFENIESKITNVINSSNWTKFISMFKKSEHIYIVGMVGIGL